MRFFPLFVAIFFFLLFSGSQADSGIPIYYTRTTPHANLAVIEVPWDRSKIQLVPIIASGGIGRDEDFASMMDRIHPIAAINGCYFDGKTKKPLGDIAINGKLLNSGWGATWGLRQNGQMEFDYHRKRTHKDYSDYQIGISCYPFLVRNGETNINNPEDLLLEGFHDPDVFREARRSAFGFSSHGTLMFVSTLDPVLMSDFAQDLQSLGLENAIGLDGGSSVGLYFNGEMIIEPTRKLPTALAIVSKN